MMPEQIKTLYALQRKDVPKAGAVLADAFRDDPVWNQVFLGSKSVQKNRLFEVPLLYCLRYGEVYATSHELEGIITWVPGDLADMTFWRMIRSGAIWSGIKLARITSQLGSVFTPIERDRKENMKSLPYLYIPVIGVASEYQGKGIGGSLLKTLIATSDQARLPVYLETETERNVYWYKRFGFEIVKQITLPGINLPMWEMLRNPTTG